MLKQAMWIAWPSFLVAGLMEMLVFAFVDPQSLHGPGPEPLELSRTAVYTLSFFVFWMVGLLSSALSVLLAAPLRRHIS